jgi:hypothetical protein
MRNLKIPIWPVYVICAAVFYFLCFYSFSKPFTCQIRHSEMLDCSEYWANPDRLWLLALLQVLRIGGPGLIALLLARKAPIVSSIWLVLFAFWTFATVKDTYGINGQNGCETCDFGTYFMYWAAWLSLIGAAILAVVVRSRRTPKIQFRPLRISN